MAVKISQKSGKISGSSQHGVLALSRPSKSTSSQKKKGESLKFAEILYKIGLDELKGGAKIEVGTGDAKPSKESFRELGASFLKEAKKIKTSKLAFDLSEFAGFDEEDLSLAQGFLEGILLGNYEMLDCKSKKSSKKDIELEIYSGNAAKAKKIKSLIKESQALANAVCFARELGDLPGNMMTPTEMGKRAQKLKSAKMTVTVWNKARIQKEKMGGLLGVSKGSAEEPRFIIMNYKGSSKAGAKPVVLVGKGLTFDAGGISIKPSAKMDEMRYDMCGGAAVLGAMKLISEMNLPINVIGVVPSSENLLGAAAIKPGDVLTARNGKTVEVLNTDAEGRLILSDALSYAAELKPKCVMSVATLTGAMVVALGNTHTGFFTRNDKLAENVNKAADVSGEAVWRMPLTDYHVKDMRGTFADLSNIASFRGAGSATAAAFLEQFIDKKVPYAHFDIAGTAWNCGSRKTYNKGNGATGVMVRTFYEYVKQFS